MIRIELTPSEATALVSELLRPRGGVWHPQHAAAVEKARDTLTGALEAWAHAGAPGVLALKAAPAVAEGKPRGRPRKAKAAEKIPEEMTREELCKSGRHLYSEGRCHFCGKKAPDDPAAVPAAAGVAK